MIIPDVWQLGGGDAFFLLTPIYTSTYVFSTHMYMYTVCVCMYVCTYYVYAVCVCNDIGVVSV